VRQGLDHDETRIARPQAGDFLQGPETHPGIELPGLVIAGIRQGRTKGLYLKELDSVRDKVSFQGLDQSAPGAAPVHARVDRHQVDFRCPREMADRKQYSRWLALAAMGQLLRAGPRQVGRQLTGFLDVFSVRRLNPEPSRQQAQEPLHRTGGMFA
jgi:hypothetical protein